MPTLAKKCYLLKDGTSPVIISGIVDYTQQASEAFDRFSTAGTHLVKFTQLISRWPNIPH